MKHIYSPLLITIFLVFNNCTIIKETESQKLHNLFNDVWEWGLQEFPTRATYLGDYRYNDRLTNMSLAGVQRRHKNNEKILRKLENLNREQLDPSDKLNYDLFHKNITRNITAHPFKEYLMPVDQMGGVQIDFPNLVDITPFRNQDDFDNYLARLLLFPEYVDQIIALMGEGLKEKITPPKIVLQKVPDQISVQYQFDVKNSPFYEPFEKTLEVYRIQFVLIIKNWQWQGLKTMFLLPIRSFLSSSMKSIYLRPVKTSAQGASLMVINFMLSG